jgi:hypothetical protein
VADIGSLDFKVSWRALLHLRLLGDLTIQRPHLRIDLAQLQEQAKSDVKLKDRGWQGAIEAIYPLKLEDVKIHDGSVLYASANPDALPLAPDQTGIRGARPAQRPVHEGDLPLSRPHGGAPVRDRNGLVRRCSRFPGEPECGDRRRIRIDRVPLDRLGSIAKVVQLKMKGGILSAHGSVESNSRSETVLLQDVLLENWDADYVTSPATKLAEKKHAEAVAKSAQLADNAPTLLCASIASGSSTAKWDS